MRGSVAINHILIRDERKARRTFGMADGKANIRIISLPNLYILDLHLGAVIDGVPADICLSQRGDDRGHMPNILGASRHQLTSL